MPTRPPVHQPLHGSAAQTKRKHDEWRGSAASRGYDAQWRRVRLQRLMIEPLCRPCRAAGFVTAADTVDHLKPIVDRPDLRLDINNTRSMCQSCHNSHTATQVADGHGGMVGRTRRL